MKQDQIYTSNDYHEFIFVEGNREIKSSKVSKMIDSIKTFGLVNPIVVDQYKQIIDGQNRFECCKTLNIPIRYSVFHVEKSKLIDLIRDINSVQNNWNNIDIAGAFVIHSKNREHYKKYLELVSLGVSHSTVIEACSYLSLGEDKIRSSYFDFRNGNLQIPNPVYEKVKGQILMLKESKIEPKIWNRIYFIRALLKLRKQDDFDIYTFLENFTKFPHQWKNAYTVEENLKSILLVHNYKNRQKAKYYFE